MSALQKLSVLFVSPLVLVIIISCDKTPTEVKPEVIEEGSWTKYTQYKWTHDGDPFTSIHCKVYSDAASFDLKKDAAEFGDKKIVEIFNKFNFSKFDDFLLPPENEKVNIYLNRNHEESIAAAFWGTVIITIRVDNLDTTRFNYLFKHELTHEFEYLIEGTPELGTDVWFREGIAIYCGGGMNYIRTNNDLNNWISMNSNYPNGGNPLTIHSWEDFPEGSDITGYYTVFDVVMKYILDSHGLGRSLDDILTLFYDIRNGIEFSNSFRNNFGISLIDLESEIFDRLAKYLNSDTRILCN